MSDFSNKVRTIGVITRISKPTVREGKAHPDSGRPYKATTDEAGNTVTEHSAPGPAPGVSDRQDVTVRPETITIKLGVNR
jgi:hypothetical protein